MSAFIVRRGLARGEGRYLTADDYFEGAFGYVRDQWEAFRFSERGLAEAVAYTFGGRVVVLRLATEKTSRTSSSGLPRASRRAA